MIDTHSHLDSTHYDSDRIEVIKRAFESGLEYIIIPAVQPEGFDNLMKIIEIDPRLYCAIGVHPHNANAVDKYLLKRIDELAKEKKVVAIGEIGLDYYYDYATPETQKVVFNQQLQIAKENKLPVIVHNRESDDDLIDILSSQQDGNLNAVLHCFSSTESVLNKALDLGFHISFTGNITFKKSNLTEIVKKTPLDRLMLETDSPYMTPAPHRGARNVPNNVKFVAEKIAEIKEISIDEVINMTTKTAKKFFGLLSILIIMLITPSLSFSQTTDDIYYDEVEDTYVNPYAKKLGIGFTIGTNTVVEYYDPIRPPSREQVSYEGIIAYGGTIQYGLFDYLILSGSFIYSKNTKLVEDFKVEPTTFSQFELTSSWIVNPHGRVNVYGMLGFSYLISNYGRPIGQGHDVFSKPAVNGGIGFFFNFPIESAGLFVFSAEWKLNYQLGVIESTRDPRVKDLNELTNISTFYSIPRINIIWYPNFLFD